MQAVEKSPVDPRTADIDMPPRMPSTGRRIDSRQLFAAGSELVIDHGGTAYFLRITRQGKLILTK